MSGWPDITPSGWPIVDQAPDPAAVAEAVTVTLGAAEKHTQLIFAKLGPRWVE